MITYTTHIVQAVTTPGAVAAMRDVSRFEQLCRACPGYGRRWGCPPLSAAELAGPDSYSRLTLVGVKIVPDAPGAPLSMAHALIDRERERLEPLLLRAEKTSGGMAALFTGMCRHCPEDSCTRPAGRPCRHPSLVRPSLEALGYNVGALAAECLDLQLLWGADGVLPEYLCIVAGLFHNDAVDLML